MNKTDLWKVSRVIDNICQIPSSKRTSLIINEAACDEERKEVLVALAILSKKLSRISDTLCTKSIVEIGIELIEENANAMSCIVGRVILWTVKKFIYEKEKCHQQHLTDREKATMHELLDKIASFSRD